MNRPPHTPPASRVITSSHQKFSVAALLILGAVGGLGCLSDPDEEPITETRDDMSEGAQDMSRPMLMDMSSSRDMGVSTSDMQPVEETCADGIKNQDETAVDCGGACGATCEEGATCVKDGDCADNTCLEKKCDASPTHGVSEIEVVTSIMYTNRNESLCHTVSCPDGKKLLGGGHDITAPDAFSPFVFSHPVNDTTWSICINSYSDVNVDTIAYAMCANTTTHAIFKQMKDMPREPESVSKNNLIAACPGADTFLTGFGIERGSTTTATPRPHGVKIMEQSVEAFYDIPSAASEPVPMAAGLYAVCGSASPVTVRSKESSVSPGALGCVTATCEAGELMVGGSYDINVTSGVAKPSQITVSRPEGADGWRVCFNNTAEQASVVANVHCLPGR